MDSFVAAAVSRAEDAKEEQPSTRCGELLCQKDSYARTTRTTVISCKPREAVPAPAPAKGKKKGAAPPPAEEKLWEVVLGDTVLFPEGGGQPSDCGTVGGVACQRVDNQDGVATHVCKGPLEPGTSVDVHLDWERREDLMCQHSTQHLVTAIALRLWGVETTSWSLGEQTSFVELGTPEVTPKMLDELEAASNEAVKAATDVTPSWHSVADVNEGAVPGLRKSSKPLPPSVTGPVRVINFQGIDTNTCCGTHVQSTARLQAVKLLRVEKSKGCCRVHYVAGGRVLLHLGGGYERADALARRLGVPQELLLERHEENAKKAAEHEKTAKALSLEVVSLLADSLKVRLAAGDKALHVNRPAADADFVKALASALDDALADSQALVLVTVGEGKGEGTFTLSGPPALVDAASAGVAKALEGRGGGKSGRFQGKCQNLGGVTDALAAASGALGA